MESLVLLIPNPSHRMKSSLFKYSCYKAESSNYNVCGRFHITYRVIIKVHEMYRLYCAYSSLVNEEGANQTRCATFLSDGVKTKARLKNLNQIVHEEIIEKTVSKLWCLFNTLVALIGNIYGELNNIV